MKTIIVTEKPEAWRFLHQDIEIISAKDYLMGPDFIDQDALRVINLCQSYQYQSTGYYVSLLAEARGHKSFPSVLTIQDAKCTISQNMVDHFLQEEMQQALKQIKGDDFVLSVYFGKNLAKRYEGFCRKLHGLFPMPMFRVFFKRKKNEWTLQKAQPLCISDVPSNHYDFLIEAAKEYLQKKRFYSLRRKTVYYDMAILHNPREKTPPSNPLAIKHFIEAGSELGIHVQLIEKEDYKTINEYDALFIRETTSVNHHTYQLARRAMSERLVVMDDPVSILKCSNKVYLAELLNKHHILTPETIILKKNGSIEALPNLDYPCVLKQPDGAFSLGVVKVNDREEFLNGVKHMFKSSDLVIAQAFTPSEFDWRIGIINGQPLFACRYYMAKDHWQIYNWQSSEEKEGDFDNVPISQAPKNVIDTALKAAKLIGDGFYGVDLKQIGDRVYVIEVNDNPNIDQGVEDSLVGDQLYHDIMSVFLQRIKRQHGYE